jgi:hypothetical protein
VTNSVTAPFSVEVPAHDHYLDGELTEQYRGAVSKALKSLSPRYSPGDGTLVVDLEKKLAMASQRDDHDYTTVSKLSVDDIPVNRYPVLFGCSQCSPSGN